LTQMVEHLRTDGLTFLGNKHRKFSRLDPPFEPSSASLSTRKDHGRGMTMRRATRATAKFEIRKCRTDSLASTELCGSSSEKHQLQSRPRSHLQSPRTTPEGILDELTEVTDPLSLPIRGTCLQMSDSIIVRFSGDISCGICIFVGERTILSTREQSLILARILTAYICCSPL